MDIKTWQNSYLHVSARYIFLTACLFHINWVLFTKIGPVFIEQIYTKYFFGLPNTCQVFPLSLWLANKDTISCVDTCLDMICATSFSSESNCKYRRTRHKKHPDEGDFTLCIVIKIHFKFHRHDQQQRSSFINNKNVIYER
jgi:Ni,Fe-hydrogenase I cytochrome b subunit